MKDTELRELLKRCSHHVFRQQTAGKHKQDREDAKALMVELEAVLREAAAR